MYLSDTTSVYGLSNGGKGFFQINLKAETFIPMAITKDDYYAIQIESFPSYALTLDNSPLSLDPKMTSVDSSVGGEVLSLSIK